MKKFCSKCGIEKDISEFISKNREKGWSHSYCKLCHSEYKKERYRKNKKEFIKKVREREARIRQENQDKIAEYFSVNQCVDCGNSDIRVLDFDHIDNKNDNIGTMLYRAKKWIEIEKEIKKCEVVCSNCHRIRTSIRSNDWRNRYFKGASYNG